MTPHHPTQVRPLKYAVLTALVFVSALRTQAELVKLDANDISFLFPAPVNAATAGALIALDAKNDAGAPIMSKEMFDDVITTAKAIEHKGSTTTVFKIRFPDAPFESSFENPATWKIAGIRIHPSSLGTSDELIAKFGSPKTLRLIVQPVTVKNDVARVHDFGAHVVFAFPDEAGFRALLDDLIAIKKLVEAKTPTNVPLSIHPGFVKDVAGFRESLRALLMKHLSSERLQIVSFMGIRPPEPWIFFAMAKSNGKLIAKDLGKDQSVSFEPGIDVKNGQMLILAGGTAVTPTLVINSQTGEGVSTAPLFTKAPSEPLFPGTTNASLQNLKLADIPDRIANPDLHHNRNTDCVSCHTESTFRRDLNLPASASAFRVPAGVSGLDSRMIPKDGWNVHNFGWFPISSSKAVETITQRAANEAAAAVDFINKKFLNKTE